MSPRRLRRWITVIMIACWSPCLHTVKRATICLPTIACTSFPPSGASLLPINVRLWPEGLKFSSFRRAVEMNFKVV
uniref:Putative secreted protein n=1 Tax=Anopheles marajoara TaxID=58244 RepID=A0A2M4CCW9_9DIPT